MQKFNNRRHAAYAAVLVVVILLLFIDKFRYLTNGNIRPRLDDLCLSYKCRVSRWDFKDTAIEKQCFAGLNPSASNGTFEQSISKETFQQPIPKVVHFIWGLQPDDPSLTFLNYLAVRSALISLKPDEVKFHYSYLDLHSEWFLRFRANVTLVYHDPDSEFWPKTKSQWNPAHLSDLLRLDILNREGGIYLDTDIIALRSFDTLLTSQRDVVLGHEGGNRNALGNGVMIARKHSRFLLRWIESYNYDTFDFRHEWSEHSVILPKKMSLKYPDEVCTLSPTVFFYPTWVPVDVAFMHSSLHGEELKSVATAIKDNEGGLYPNQLAYHASRHAGAAYLQSMSPKYVKEHDSRFNLLVRRFLEDEI